MERIRLATWNIRKAVGLDRRRDPERVMAAIAGLGADVVALQEADRRLGDRPAALPRDRIGAATGLVPVPVDNGRSLGWHGNAILAAPGFEVSDVRPVDLPGFEPRGALMADLACDGIVLRVVALHLGLARRHRRRQLEHLAALLDDLVPAPTVILGDFNEWSPAQGLEALGPGFRVHAPGASYHAARPVARLDRIAHDDRLALTSSGVHRCAISARASDHLPVWAELRAVSQPAAPPNASGFASRAM